MAKLFQEATKGGSWIVIFGSLLSAVLGGFLGSYFQKRGQLKAVSDNFERSLKELKEQTKEVEKIKVKFAEDIAEFQKELRGHEVLEQSELEFRKLQLAEFYGPIYAYCKLNKGIYAIFMARKLQDINKDVIAVFRRNNEEVLRILATKLHLVEGSELPDHFAHWATSVTLWNIYTAREHEPWVPDEVAALPQLKYPDEFDSYISATTEQLKQRLDELYKRYVIR